MDTEGIQGTVAVLACREVLDRVGSVQAYQEDSALACQVLQVVLEGLLVPLGLAVLPVLLILGVPLVLAHLEVLMAPVGLVVPLVQVDTVTGSESVVVAGSESVVVAGSESVAWAIRSTPRTWCLTLESSKKHWKSSYTSLSRWP